MGQADDMLERCSMPHLDSRLGGDDRDGAGTGAYPYRVAPSPSSSPIKGEGMASFARVCRGAKPLCRESEGVPQSHSSLPPRMGARGLTPESRCSRMLPGFGVSPSSVFPIPQEWGIEGVEKASPLAAIRIPGQVGDLTLTSYLMTWRMKTWKS